MKTTVSYLVHINSSADYQLGIVANGTISLSRFGKERAVCFNDQNQNDQNKINLENIH